MGSQASPRAGWQRTSLVFGILVVILALAVFVPLSVQAWNNDVASWDFRLSDWIHAYENRETLLDRWVNPLDVALKAQVQLIGVLVVAGVTLTLVARGERRLAFFVAAGVIGAAALGPLLKEIFAQPPVGPPGENGGNYSFPSGHALRSMAAGAAIGVVAWPTRWRWPVFAASTLVVLVIGIALVYHEWHLVSDVIGGWCVAVAWIAGVWLLLRLRDTQGGSVRVGRGTPSLE